MEPEDRAKAGARHVDHEIAQVLQIRQWLDTKELREELYPVLRVAFAAHLRALLEFFHGSRPKSSLHATDVRYSNYLDSDGDPFGGWAPAEVARLDDADKLLGHISALRDTKTGLPEWGSDSDMDLVLPKIRHLLESVPDAAELFPRTHGFLVTAPRPLPSVPTSDLSPSALNPPVVGSVVISAAMLVAILIAPWSVQQTKTSLLGNTSTTFRVLREWAPIWDPPGPVYSLDIGGWLAQVFVAAVGLALLWWLLQRRSP